MTFNVEIGNTVTAMATDDGIPYLWGSGDVSTAPSNETQITDFTYTEQYDQLSICAVGCGRIVVGAHQEDGPSNSYTQGGRIWIYDLDGNIIARVYNSGDYTSLQRFGYSTAVGCGKIVAGAPIKDNGTNSEQGAAYIYDLDGNNQIKLLASDGAASDYFGNSVSVGCGKIVVGAPFNDDNGTNSGSVYIYDLDGTNEIKITASDAAANDQFGSGVVVGNGRIVVGAPGDASSKGAAYIFTLGGTEVKKIVPVTTNQLRFGQERNISIGSGRIVIGETGGSAVIGAAHIYDLDGNFIKKLTPPDTTNNVRFGSSTAVGCGRIVINASSVGGSYVDYGIYVFDLDGNFIDKLTPSPAGAGYPVSVGCGKIVAGAAGIDGPSFSYDEGGFYIYDTPNVYTPYDIADLQSY